MMERVPQIGEIKYYMQSKVSIMKIWDYFHLAEIREINSDQYLMADICTLSNEPDYSKTISLWLFRRTYMSILSYIDGYMDGNAWEDLCVMCYRLRYQDDHYTPISASQGGDGGIEGFTQSGVVNQCYCPEKDYSAQECYEHLREKMTKDIAKLLKPDYQKRLTEWGFLQFANGIS